jgi:hypothetical protein
MRILVNFMLRGEVWHIHAVSEDAKTPISPFRQVRDQATLIRLLRYVGASDAEIEEVHTRIRQWSRGGVFLDLAPGRRNLLKIRPPWNADLAP